jgi:hypothetical protein
VRYGSREFTGWIQSQLKKIWRVHTHSGLTLGETGAQETRDLLDEGIGSDESIVLARELLDQLLVFVELLEIVCGHGVDTSVLGTVDIVLVTKNAATSFSLLSLCELLRR